MRFFICTVILFAIGNALAQAPQPSGPRITTVIALLPLSCTVLLRQTPEETRSLADQRNLRISGQIVEADYLLRLREDCRRVKDLQRLIRQEMKRIRPDPAAQVIVRQEAPVMEAAPNQTAAITPPAITPPAEVPAV